MESENPEIWNQPAKLNQLNQEKIMLEKSITDYQGLQVQVDDALVLLDMAKEAEDEDSFSEVKEEACGSYRRSVPDGR